MSCRCDLAAPCPTPAGRFTVGTSDKLVREVVGTLCRLSNYLALGATFAGVIGITVMVIFVRRQNRSEGPMIDFSLFSNGRLTAGVFTAMISTLAGTAYNLCSRKVTACDRVFAASCGSLHAANLDLGLCRRFSQWVRAPQRWHRSGTLDKSHRGCDRPHRLRCLP